MGLVRLTEVLDGWALLGDEAGVLHLANAQYVENSTFEAPTSVDGMGAHIPLEGLLRSLPMQEIRVELGAQGGALIFAGAFDALTKRWFVVEGSARSEP